MSVLDDRSAFRCVAAEGRVMILYDPVEHCHREGAKYAKKTRNPLIGAGV
jgi:hypothetical protein